MKDYTTNQRDLQIKLHMPGESLGGSDVIDLLFTDIDAFLVFKESLRTRKNPFLDSASAYFIEDVDGQNALDAGNTPRKKAINRVLVRGHDRKGQRGSGGEAHTACSFMRIFRR